MTQTQENSEGFTVQHKIYDSLFIAVFGKDSERSKRWRLELYNALNNTNYTDPDALMLNTLDNVLFIKMHNDVSFLVDSQMTLFEHQRTTNQNMPLRGFFYFSQLYHKFLINAEEQLTSSTLIKIPNPNYVVFYNGDTIRDEDYELKLSDAFMQEDKSGRYEWTARVLNINKDYNLPLQKKCKSLYDYIQFTSRIKQNRDNGMQTEKAVDEAIEWASEQNLLEGYIREQKAEVKMTLLTEFNEELSIKGWLRDGIIQGKQEKAIEAARNFYANKVPIEVIAKSLKMPEEEVRKIVSEPAPEHL
ncbi:hypothetical protein [Treponema bryantii]|uniref:hypothetical protein n=1 Tax=Treponema bryantii TaxID=163 RepID=UPI0003B4038C|nr:hypothetical protein [Treponema bryantii]